MTLKGKQDGFKLTIPESFICDEIKDKYAKIIQDQKSFAYRPIDFLNETIQSVQILGFVDSTIPQQQSGRGLKPLINPDRKDENRFMHTSTDYNYRSEKNPVALIDKTLNVYFRHTLGFVNYFLLFENFFYQYSRDRKYQELTTEFHIDIMNQLGEVYSRIVISDPIINSIDMLDLNYNQPVAQSQNFKVEFKYSNIDYQFIFDKNELYNEE